MAENTNRNPRDLESRAQTCSLCLYVPSSALARSNFPNAIGIVYRWMTTHQWDMAATYKRV
jgi:hypothetical protein